MTAPRSFLIIMVEVNLRLTLISASEYDPK
jgi:hypothetical protein